MPTMSIYVNNEIYAYLLKNGDMGTPSTIGKQWIVDEYERRKASAVQPTV